MILKNTFFSFRAIALIACSSIMLTSCGGGGGGSDDASDPLAVNNSCSLLKRATTNSTQLQDAQNRLSTVKIINGDPCGESGSPVVELLLVNAQDQGFACSATMLTNQYGLTAAHCFDAGITRAAVSHNGQILPIEAVRIHPKAKDTSQRYENDLAVFKLASPSNIPTAPILVSKSVESGDILYIFGYGRATPGSAASENEELLRGGEMRASGVDGQSIYANYDGVGQNACFGDSGGPAMIDVDGTLALVGVTSTGKDGTNCGAGDINLFANAQASAGLDFISTYVPNLQTR